MKTAVMNPVKAFTLEKNFFGMNAGPRLDASRGMLSAGLPLPWCGGSDRAYLG